MGPALSKWILRWSSSYWHQNCMEIRKRQRGCWQHSWPATCPPKPGGKSGKCRPDGKALQASRFGNKDPNRLTGSNRGITMARNRGFTLIELMIVVAIIAILAAIALHAYQDYLTRTQVSEALSLSRGAQIAVAEYYSEKGVAPPDNASAGLAQPTSISGNYVESVTLGNADGMITILFGNEATAKINGKTLSMDMSAGSGSLTWDCDGIDPKYLPSVCRN